MADTERHTGPLHKKYESLSSNMHFSKAARRIGLDKVLLLTQGKTGKVPEATLVEAIVGAVYIDSGKSDMVTRMAIDAMALGQPTTFGSGSQKTLQTPATSGKPSSRELFPITMTAADTASDSSPTETPLPPVSEPQEDLVVESPRQEAKDKTEEPTSKLKTRKNKQRLMRRRILSRYVPGATRATTTNQLLKSIKARLEKSPGDVEVGELMSGIEDVLQTYRPGDQPFESARALFEQINNVQILSPTISSEETEEAEKTSGAVSSTSSLELIQRGSSSDMSGEEAEPTAKKTVRKARQNSPLWLASLRFHHQERKVRRLLRAHVPGASKSTSWKELVALIKAYMRAPTSPGDGGGRDQMRNENLARIEGVLRECFPHTSGAVTLSEILDQIQPPKAASITTLSGGDGGVGEMPDATPKNLYAQFHV